jgi:DNA-binding transcriptional regulator YdaS (Cro superfamily)
MKELLEYINSLPKDYRGPFAQRCGTTEGYIRRIAYTEGRVLGSKVCVAIERESQGKVTRQMLRPEDFQEIWPELGA